MYSLSKVSSLFTFRRHCIQLAAFVFTHQLLVCLCTACLIVASNTVNLHHPFEFYLDRRRSQQEDEVDGAESDEDAKQETKRKRGPGKKLMQKLVEERRQEPTTKAVVPAG